jgi:hypothetical protein
MDKLRYLFLGMTACGLWACPRPHWTPPPPAGRTWEYQSQGAFTAASSFGGGTMGRVSYGFAFGAKGLTEMPSGQSPDGFWRQQTLSHTRFNSGLADQGEQVVPGPEGPRPRSLAAQADQVPPPEPAGPAETPPAPQTAAPSPPRAKRGRTP